MKAAGTEALSLIDILNLQAYFAGVSESELYVNLIRKDVP